ncbi:hypothetical protein [Treponema parvum]|uniref:DUF4325 domain-containing protein n=1 Tax=Treponema parvum TaxID=138851 RepID=A0A975F5G6_9SPIR|nr:hypothetical protein [Treponema parvum]QTQ15049.1 hypothetical protein HRQ91_11590 [Treponema parvum]
MEYQMDKYGTNITNEEVTSKLSNDIMKIINDTKDEIITLNFGNIKLLSTIAARSIFKPIADKYNLEKMFQRIEMLNVEKDLRVILNHALNSLVSET